MNRKQGVGLFLASLAGMTLSMAMAAAPGALGTDAGMSSEIVTQEECTWYLLNAPTSIALTTDDPDQEYEGVLMTVSASISDFNVHSSGNVNAGSTTTHAECTFYGTGNVSRPIVTLTIGDLDFDAAYASTSGQVADTGVSFDLASTNALDFTWLASDCAAKWTQNDLGLYTAATATTFLEIALVANVTDPVASGAGQNDRCIDDVYIEVDIPANMKPDSPGATYTWTGPTLTTALTTSTE